MNAGGAANARVAAVAVVEKDAGGGKLPQRAVACGGGGEGGGEGVEQARREQELGAARGARGRG